MSKLFNLKSEYPPAGDQPQAISQLTAGLQSGKRYQTLEGVTGSGKTFTLANVIAAADRPVLVLSHNKTLAAQLFSEFKSFFPDNAVEYFISYYDYYLPESYIPQTDTYIAKDASINENIEKFRLAATSSLLERRDVIIVASVSCIYGLGSPEDYANMCVSLEVGGQIDRNEVIRQLIAIQYERNDTAPEKGQFKVRGDLLEVYEPQRDDFIRVSWWGKEIESISRHSVMDGKVKTRPGRITFYPCKHFVLPPDRIQLAINNIKAELAMQVKYFEKNNLLVEAQRIHQRVTYDIEMMLELGYCSGIENYSRHLANRPPGSRPFCLFDFFPKDFITVIDESHVTLPQLQAMFKADRSRKQTLIDHGFRLPSALDNRPLKFEEFEQLHGDMIFVSATPGNYELQHSGKVVEQLIRPTGLLDPLIEVRPLENQIDDVIAEVREATARGERVIITTLTKKNSERLSDYLTDLKIKAAYLHSDLDALERIKVLNNLQEGKVDCLIGINLLREGIDLPQVALVAILDADKEGFLRSDRSLIQVAGRAARNVSGRVILYGDTVTPSMKRLIDGSKRRRELQMQYNLEHNITPKSISKSKRQTITDIVGSSGKSKKSVDLPELAEPGEIAKRLSSKDFAALLNELEKEMLSAAQELEFERAADLRDQIKLLKKQSN